MSVPLTGSGSLFQRLGVIWGGVADDLAEIGAAATARVLSGANWATRVGTLQTDYAAGTSDLEIVSGDNGFGQSLTPLNQIFDSWAAGFASKFASLQAIASATVVKMCDRDSPSGLRNRTLSGALQYLINQMNANSTTVNATTVSVGAQTASGSPVGNPVLVVSAINGAGQTLAYSWADTFTIVTTQDAQTGNAAANQQQLTFNGGALNSNQWSYLWPGGSGIAVPVTLTDPTASNANGNLIYNGSFESVTNTDYVDNWVYLAGVATTNFKKATGTVYFGSNSLELVGDGATLCSVAQPFNTTASTTAGGGGSPAKLLPQTPYLFNLNYALSAGSPAAGVLEVSLVDGTNTIINNTAGTQNKVTVALTGVSDTSWHQLNGAFQLPASLPSTIKLRIRFSTALSNGTSLFIDGVALTPGKALYTGGPFAAGFAGNTATLLNDTWTLAYTPTWGTVQQYCERFFSMKSLGLQLPQTASSPTVADSVIA